MKYRQLGLVGCGLMGGSFALALKRANLVQRVVGCSLTPETTEQARELGVIDAVAKSAREAASGADLVLLAVPVAATEATLKALRDVVTPDMLLMDVGSTKRDVVDAARRALRDKVGGFVPAHPVAGKERAGVEHAEAKLFDGRQVILTPFNVTSAGHLEQARALWRALGAEVNVMTAEAHDAAFAAVSHLPHLLSFAFFAGILNQSQAQDFLALAGPGFRDFTRIAAGDPAMWRDILIANREEVLRQSSQFRAALNGFEQLLKAGDATALAAVIQEVSLARSRWSIDASRSGAAGGR
jgi:prephenate dehydrogenase